MDLIDREQALKAIKKELAYQEKHATPGEDIDTAIKRAAISWQCSAVEWAFDQIPEGYRAGIWRNIIYRERFPDYAHLNTWKAWKQKVIYLVAWKAGII